MSKIFSVGTHVGYDMTQRPNVLLVILDGVRAANTSLHGYNRQTTPFLEDFAESATRYSHAIAPAPKSITSHASMFTGMHAVEHGLTNRGHALSTGHTIWEHLAGEYGYGTGVFSSNLYLTELDVGLQSAFDTVCDGRTARLPFPGAVDPYSFKTNDGVDISGFLQETLKSRTPVRSIVNAVILQANALMPWAIPKWFKPEDMDGDLFVNEFLSWIPDDAPWAACVNLMDTHYPYHPRPEHNLWGNEALISEMYDLPLGWGAIAEDKMDRLEDIESLYDCTIRQADTAVKCIIEGLKQKSMLEDTLVVITADHGEGFGERSYIRDMPCSGHGVGGGIDEPLLHVPLLVKAPQQKRKEEIAKPVSLTSFPAAVKQLLDGDEPSFDHHDVVASMAGLDEYSAERARKSLTEEQMEPYWHDARVVYNKTEKETILKHMKCGESKETIEIDSQGNVIGTEVDAENIVDTAFGQFQSTDVLRGSQDSVDDSVKERLSDLGYA
ncbi:sulfatase-like hydrolase/transferase [Haloarchaeobius sp. DYHT-AS-18]|uniref:sulfatase-like hydrolase/transferase n=1 Tax=Haloarchaeobius sp. DYHT-AS-18 TaxID=3446117 RepID=UPI003EB700C7